MQPRKPARSATLALVLIGSILLAIAAIVMLFVWFMERDDRIRIAEERRWDWRPGVARADPIPAIP